MPKYYLFPALDGFGPTRQTLQLYSRAVRAIPRAYAEPHPKWWHVSLNVHADGLLTDKIILPDGSAIHLKMDLVRHGIVLYKGEEPVSEWSMMDGISSTVLGDEIIAAVEALGLSGGDYGRSKFAYADPRTYDSDAAERFFTALTHANRIFNDHRATLPGEYSAVQLWPHGFDLSMDWFGTRIETYEEQGEVQSMPAQLNLGFYPAETDDAYFFSNPWPFEAETLLDKPLPEGARWHTEGWQGTILPYAELVNDPDAEARLREFARTVFDLAFPTLMVQQKES